LIELVTLGLEPRSQTKERTFERRIAARCKLVNSKEAAAKVPLR
jgi:hypothetical protein